MKSKIFLLFLALLIGGGFYFRKDIHREGMRAYFERIRGTGPEKLREQGADLVDREKYREAVTLMRRAAVAYPSDRHLRQVEGTALVKSGRMEEGAELILGHADTLRIPPPVYEDIVAYLHEGKRYDDVLYVVSRNDPGRNQNVLYYFAHALYMKKKYREALPVARDAVKEGRTEGDAWRLLGLLQEKNGDVPGAVKSLEEARRKSERDPDIVKALIGLYRKQGRYKDAEKLMRMRYSFH